MMIDGWEGKSMRKGTAILIMYLLVDEYIHKIVSGAQAKKKVDELTKWTRRRIKRPRFWVCTTVDFNCLPSAQIIF